MFLTCLFNQTDDCRALQHWHRRVLQHLLLAWRNRVSESAVEWQLATALCFHKCSLQRIALGSWQLAMQEQQERRTAAVQLLQQVQQQQLMQLVKQAAGCWQSVAQGLKQLQSTEAELVRRSRQQRKKQVHMENSLRVRVSLGCMAMYSAGQCN